MPFEDFLIMEGEGIIEGEYCMSKLVDMAFGRRKEPLGFDLNEEPLDSLNVDERSPSVVKLINAQPHAQVLVAFFNVQPI